MLLRGGATLSVLSVTTRGAPGWQAQRAPGTRRPPGADAAATTEATQWVMGVPLADRPRHAA
eukprot:1111510-Pyramimonas_sp.AAC.1